MKRVKLLDKKLIKNGMVFEYNGEYYVRLGSRCVKLLQEETEPNTKSLVYFKFDTFKQENIAAIYKSNSDLLCEEVIEEEEKND